MYLFLGQSMVVAKADVVGVFDLDNSTGSRITRDFLAAAEKRGRVVDVSGELPKSFVLSASRRGKKPGKAERVYLSQLAPSTLLRRWDESIQ